MRITKNQAEEIGHKISILCDTEDLQSDYGLTQEQANALYDSIPHNGGEWVIPEWGIEAVKGELEDHAKVLRAIAEGCRQADEVGQMLSAHRDAYAMEKIVDRTKNPAAVALGSIKSERKAKSSATNGKKGGRPRKQP